MKTKMRAAILYEPKKPMVVEEITIDEPQDHEVMVRPSRNGDMPQRPLADQGRRTAGVPCRRRSRRSRYRGEGRPGVTGVRPGDHVIIACIYSCGKCHSCVGGQPSLCLESLPWHLMGGLPGGGKRLHKGDQDLNIMYRPGLIRPVRCRHERQAFKVSPEALWTRSACSVAV